MGVLRRLRHSIRTLLNIEPPKPKVRSTMFLPLRRRFDFFLVHIGMPYHCYPSIREMQLVAAVNCFVLYPSLLILPSQFSFFERILNCIPALPLLL